MIKNYLCESKGIETSWLDSCNARRLQEERWWGEGEVVGERWYGRGVWRVGEERRVVEFKVVGGSV